MSLVGKKAPVFKTGAVINGEEIVEDFSLEQYIGKKDVIFFFYPKDFTFVCPTEILAFQEKLAEFEKRGVAVVGASTDTEETHLAWLMTPQENGGIEGVIYPLVADASKTIANNFGVLAGDWNYNEEGQLIFEGTPVAYRGTFLIDKEGIVRHETINDLPLGRNIDEMLRIVDAWQHVEKYGEVCPANWEEGKEAMQASKESVSSYLAKNKK
ncbi:peroxiredoxin [Marivirga sp.]|uniref:peroxiredoxin n=1 Tax=Marivirga sp. TaxID=2018662 RepID=UPI002D7FE238|nr:peroxiredoxin [Marivirga sp.]HET8860802.1 peroxiredoxin [Marivirga sp.]